MFAFEVRKSVLIKMSRIKAVVALFVDNTHLSSKRLQIMMLAQIKKYHLSFMTITKGAGVRRDC